METRNSKEFEGNFRPGFSEVAPLNTDSEGDESSRNGNSIKDWSCSAAHFRLVPPDLQAKDRVKRMREMKSVAAEGLNSTPYVRIKWANGEENSALFDTGAQWSLITEKMLTDEERSELQGATVAGQGVSGEKIPVIGEIWRDVSVGKYDFFKQRFVVVEKMICPIILGMDFWSRAEKISFDFSKKTISINDDEEEIRLFSSPKIGDSEKNRPYEVLVEGEPRIPPKSEALIACMVPRMKVGEDYMVQPLSMGQTLVGTPYGLVEGTKEGKIMLKVTNLGDEEVVLRNNDCIATISDDDWVADHKPGRAFNTTQKRSDINWAEMVNNDLDHNKKSQLIDLLQKYDSVFYTEGKLPIVKVGIEHTIRLKEESTPTAFKPRRLSKELSDEVHEHIEKLLKMGVIRESNSIWASPVVCARRADGTLRLVIDYRMANEQSLTATLHPLPVIDDLIDRLGKAKYFATIDAKSGYHQMPLRKEDSDITAFVVPWGHYEFAERTPFGLKGAGYSFQRMMSAVLGSSNYVEALCYLDDILIWGETWEIFIKRLKKVMGKISTSGLALSAEKCRFGMTEVSYLGCKIKHGMMSIKEQRVEQLRNISRPKSVRELRRALGAFAYVQRWLPGLAEVYKSLYEAVSGKPYERLKWTGQMISDFEKIKKMIADAVALSLPDLERRFVLVTDCSENGAGAMLAQESKTVSGFLQPVSFYHHALSASEQRYSATEKELLAVVLAVKKYRIYLGRDFDLITDHEALKWLKSLNPEDEIGRRGRWFDLLQQFSMTIIPKKGRSPEMSMADFMSRVRSNGSCSNIMKPGDDQDESDRIMVFSASTGDAQDEIRLNKEMLIKAQNADQSINLVKKAIKEGNDLNPGRSDSDNWRLQSTDLDGTTAEIWKHKDRLFVDKDGILRIKWNGGRKNQINPNGVKVMERIIVPESCKDMVLKLVHASESAAHMGVDRT